ncbi:MAG: flippase-like domain-containing protein [Planctomycetes bacterium]|nr:flippase-like domain-containing protein [Planctomycetota bacterium]
MSVKIRKLLLNLLKFAIVFAALYYLVATGKLNFHDIRFLPGNFWLVAVAAVGVLVAMLFAFLRWYLLLRGVGAPLPARAVLRLGAIGIFFNTFMLGAFGGDLIKMAYLVRETHKRATGFASIIVDRICGLLGLLCLGGVAIFFFWQTVNNPELQRLAVFFFGILAALALSLLAAFVSITFNRVTALAGIIILLCLQVFLVSRHAWDYFYLLLQIAAVSAILAATATAILIPSLLPGGGLANFVRGKIPLGHKLMNFIEALLAFRHHAGLLLGALGLSIIIHTCCLLALAMLARAAGSLATAEQIFLTAPPALIANILPVPGGGLGVGEAAFAGLLGLCRDAAGNPISGGAILFLMYRAITILLGIALGLPFYLYGKVEIQQLQKEATE